MSKLPFFKHSITIKSIPDEIPWKRFSKGHKYLLYIWYLWSYLRSSQELKEDTKTCCQYMTNHWPKLAWKPNFLKPPFLFESLIESFVKSFFVFYWHLSIEQWSTERKLAEGCNDTFEVFACIAGIEYTFLTKEKNSLHAWMLIGGLFHGFKVSFDQMVQVQRQVV